ncbi:MAG: DNA (cytosine-5-)-methyltransferase [Bacteroidota bacterium]
MSDLKAVCLDDFINTDIKSLIQERLQFRKAALTHYLHNHKNPIAVAYKKEALSFVKNSLEISNPELTVDDNLANITLLELLNDPFSNILYPPPLNPSFTFIDLFAGIGGFRLAGQRLGGKCVFSSEWDSHAQSTYLANFGEVPFGDITTDEIKNLIPEKFDILFAGFPCQPFSYAGRNAGFEDKTRGTLFFDILDILKKHTPAAFLLENVKGLKSHDGGKTLSLIVESLRNLGYNIKWHILNSYDFGLPQYRERWYCVGLRKEVDFTFPTGNSRGVSLKSIIDEDSNRNSKLKLSDFEIDRINFHFNSKGERVQHDNSRYASKTKKGRHGVYSYQKPDGSLRFHIGDKAKTQIQEAFYACLETYAPTIIANRVPKLWDLKRRLSVLESKRLQGFPDDFKFIVSDNQAYRQLGNSVSVPVLSSVIEEIIRYI